MNHTLKFTAIALTLASGLAFAQLPPSVPPATSPGAISQSGIDRMRAIIDGVTGKSTGGLDAKTQAAITSGVQSAKTSSNLENMDAKTVDFAIAQSSKFEQMAREAYVAALPPRDRALGASVILGDGTAAGEGRMYIFVSRSMPQSLLRAYAVDAFYMGAQLVVKGIRKGDTIKEYVQNAMEEFNSLDGMVMSGMEINPNLFDMFNINVVPAVVWTNRVGLDDVGSGCQNLPEGIAAPQLSLLGPDDQYMTVDKPTCAQLPESSYFKIAGSLTLPYVLDRFEEAGLPRSITDEYRGRLAERTNNLHDGSVTQTTGNAMAPVSYKAKFDRLPKAVLQGFQEQLQSFNVQRGPFGPTFSPDAEDDPAYREELEKKIRHGLGL